MLLAWCHPSVWKRWKSSLSPNSDTSPMFLACPSKHRRYFQYYYPSFVLKYLSANGRVSHHVACKIQQSSPVNPHRVNYFTNTTTKHFSINTPPSSHTCPQISFFYKMSIIRETAFLRPPKIFRRCEVFS